MLSKTLVVKASMPRAEKIVKHKIHKEVIFALPILKVSEGYDLVWNKAVVLELLKLIKLTGSMELNSAPLEKSSPKVTNELEGIIMNGVVKNFSI